MLKWLKSRLKDKRAQFFIISTVLVVTSLSTIAIYLRGYSEIDNSEVVEINEDYQFNNIKNVIKSTVDGTNCPELETNLRELDLTLTKEYRLRGIDLDIRYSNINSVCPGANPVDVMMNLSSSDVIITDSFTYP